MNPLLSLLAALRDMGDSSLRWLAGWWRLIVFGAQILVLALSPSTYRAASRANLMRHIYQATAPNLLWFTVFSALVSIVLIRIVVVTALSYGLAQYALEMVVRVLVLELIPLTAALFVAVHYSIPHGSELYKMHTRGGFEALRSKGLDPVARELLPAVLAGVFAVLTLAAVSCVMTLVLAYLAVYGFTSAAFMGYTRTVGQVFNPVVTLIFGLKTLCFSLAVSLIPAGTALQDLPRKLSRASVEMQGLIRMFAVLVLVEVASLVGNYY
jgi:phospholipid/cholesterol/gamma-HCH transport system permease protein